MWLQGSEVTFSSNHCCCTSPALEGRLMHTQQTGDVFLTLILYIWWHFVCNFNHQRDLRKYLSSFGRWVHRPDTSRWQNQPHTAARLYVVIGEDKQCSTDHIYNQYNVINHVLEGETDWWWLFISNMLLTHGTMCCDDDPSMEVRLTVSLTCFTLSWWTLSPVFIPSELLI